MPADLILLNGRIHTMNPAQPTATALAIHDGKIVAVGNDDTIKQLLTPHGKRIDLGGRGVTPGLVDAHVHFSSYALQLQRVELSGTTSLEDALSRVQAKLAAGKPVGGWLQGRGWKHDDWATPAFPTAAALDSVAPNLPTCLRDKSGHAAWVNSAALQAANITAETADPPGGQIQRDHSGNPTGILFEEAIQLVEQHIRRPTPTAIANAMRAAQQKCWELGLTGLHDFDGRDCFRALQMLHANGELGLRMVKNIPDYRYEHAIGVGLRSGFGDDWLRIGSVKIFADGALGPRTASMVEPYEGDPDNYGIIVTDKEEMLHIASEASRNGLSTTVHAIGDRANHDILDVFEAVRKQERERGESATLRHRIEHVQILHPNDVPRLAQLNVIASMQPIHATGDMEIADLYWGDRNKFSYAWRTMLDTGALLVFGSDAPVEPIAPLLGIHAAVTRQKADNTPAGGWRPTQKLTMQETIHAFTTAAALTAGSGARLGTLASGKLADLTIFSRDLWATPDEELLSVKIEGTMVNGRFRHRTF